MTGINFATVACLKFADIILVFISPAWLEETAVSNASLAFAFGTMLNSPAGYQ